MDLLPRAEAEQRVRRLQSWLRQTETDAAFVYQNADLYYFSGTVQSGLLCIPVAGEPLYVVHKSLRRAQIESPWGRLIPMGDPRTVPDILAGEGLGNLQRVALEMDVLPTQHFLRLQKVYPGIRFVDGSDAIRRIRMIKSPAEVDRIRRAGLILSRTLAEAGSRMHPGMTELDLAATVESSLRREGHPGFTRMRMFNGELAFGTVSSGPSAAYPTCFPGPVGYVGISPANPAGAGWRRLTPGETLMIDVTGGHGGYIADKTRTYALRQAPADMARAHSVVLQMMAGIEERLRPGMRCDELYRYALEYIRDTPYAPGFMGTGDSQVRFIGHGVGLELDELPVLASGFDIELQPGMVVALEPKIFFPDRGGVGIENTYLITEAGCENLTVSPEHIIEVAV